MNIKTVIITFEDGSTHIVEGKVENTAADEGEVEVKADEVE